MRDLAKDFQGEGEVVVAEALALKAGLTLEANNSSFIVDSDADSLDSFDLFSSVSVNFCHASCDHFCPFLSIVMYVDFGVP